MIAIARIRTVCITTALALGASVAVVVAQPAHAALGDVVCTPPSNSATVYSPALTSSPQTVNGTATLTLSSCVSTTVPAITSGTAATSFVAPNRSCLNLTGSSSGTATITWNTGQTSTMSVNSLVTVVGGVYAATSTGTVTSGLFAGDTVTVEHLGSATDILLCSLGLGTVSTVPATTTLVFA